MYKFLHNSNPDIVYDKPLTVKKLIKKIKFLKRAPKVSQKYP